MFIRRKTINNKPKFYLVENRREGKQVKQKVLAYLGESNTIEGAILELEENITRCRAGIDETLRRAEEKRMQMPERQQKDVPTRCNNYANSNTIWWYWYWTKYARRIEKRIPKIDSRIEKLRNLCSA